MKMAVDVSVLEFPLSGIARVVLGLYDACFRIDPTIEIAGVHQNSLQCALPACFRDDRWGDWLHRRLWRRIALPAYLRVKRPEVVHFPWNNGAVRSHKHCLTVLTIHDVIPLALPDMHFRNVKHRESYCRRMQNALDKSDLVLTDSEASKQDISKYLNPHSEPAVVYPGLSFKETTLRDNQMQKKEHGGYYIYQGGYHPRKGMQQLVPVFRDLYRQRQVAHPLVLVGKPNHDIAPGLGAQIEAGIKEGALIEKGYVSDEELSHLMKGAIALIYPSFYEGFGLPLLEAMSVGCPVVTTNVSSIPEVCGDAAVYFTPGDRDALAKAIVLVEGDAQLQFDLQVRGFAQAKKFSWDTSAHVYLELLANTRERT
ncbi:MAG: glycosyltransferase family 4 protein [Pirellulales bacterium]|nr:glycosyltransferase family 4 protein [Pirellulales bacterium]